MRKFCGANRRESPKVPLSLAITIVAISLLFTLTAVADSQNAEVVEVVGEAPIQEGNVTKAKEVALENAFRKAVTKTMGTWVSAKSFSRNYQSIENSVLTKSKGFVKSYEVLNVQVTDKLVRSSVKVSVSLVPLKDSLESLGILLRSMDNPRVVVQSTNSILESHIEKNLKKKGFSVLPLQIKDWSEEVSPDMIDTVSHETQAEVLVAAQASTQRSTSTNGMWGKVINFSLESFWLNSGERIVDSSNIANGSGTTEETAFNKALENASPGLISSFIEKLSKAWNDLLQNGRPLELTIDEVSYNLLKTLRERLLGLYGVKDVIQRSFENNKAVLEVYFTDSSQVLADLISVTKFSDDIEVIINTVKRDLIKTEVAKS